MHFQHNCIESWIYPRIWTQRNLKKTKQKCLACLHSIDLNILVPNGSGKSLRLTNTLKTKEDINVCGIAKSLSLHRCRLVRTIIKIQTELEYLEQLKYCYLKWNQNKQKQKKTDITKKRKITLKWIKTRNDFEHIFMN